MSCFNHRLQISAALDKLLPEAEKADLQKHLSACASCRSFEEEQREMALFLKAAHPDLEPPDRIWQRIEQRIREQEAPSAPHRRQLDWLRDAFRFPQWGYAAAAIVLAAAMSLTIFNWNNSADLDRMLAELDAYQPEIRRNPWLAGPSQDNPFFQATHDRSRNPFSDFRSEK